MSASGSGSAGSRRVQRITESGSGSPDATPSVNGSDCTAVAALVVSGGVVVSAGVVVSGGVVVSVVSVARGPLDVFEADSPLLQAASAAAIVPARKLRRVSRGHLSSTSVGCVVTLRVYATGRSGIRAITGHIRASAQPSGCSRRWKIMKTGDDEQPQTMRDDLEVGGVSAEREYVRRVAQQEHRIEAAWRWSHRVDCRSFV